MRPQTIPWIGALASQLPRVPPKFISAAKGGHFAKVRKLCKKTVPATNLMAITDKRVYELTIEMIVSFVRIHKDTNCQKDCEDDVAKHRPR